jgi:hypothetical protein
VTSSNGARTLAANKTLREKTSVDCFEERFNFGSYFICDAHARVTDVKYRTNVVTADYAVKNRRRNLRRHHIICYSTSGNIASWRVALI